LTCRDLLPGKKKPIRQTMVLDKSRETAIFLEKSGIKHFSWIFRNRMPINPFETRAKRILTLVKNIYGYYKNRKIFKELCFKVHDKMNADSLPFMKIAQSPIWKKNVSYMFEYSLPLTEIIYRESLLLFETGVVNAILANDGYFHYSKIVLKAATEAGIQRVCVQHGLQNVLKIPFNEMTLFDDFSHNLFFGEGVFPNDFSTNNAKKVVGSLFIEKNSKQKVRKTKNNIRIIYPLNLWAKDFITYNFLGATDYFNLVVRILDFLLGFESGAVEVFVKTYSDIYGRQDILKNTHSACKHIKFISQGYTADHVQDCDIMLVDCPASSIMEGIAANLKIMTLNPLYEIFPAAKELLKKRVFYSEDEADFFKVLKKVMETGSAEEIEKWDDEFERQYIGPIRDGKNIDRYVKAFNEILSI
jgi:hypothetical protein